MFMEVVEKGEAGMQGIRIDSEVRILHSKKKKKKKMGLI